MHPYTLGTLVTANARLSRQLRREYSAACRVEGHRVWESPDILPLDAWLTRAWQECVYRNPENSPLLLSAVQELALWEQAIAASASENALLDLASTAEAAADAWHLLHSWEVVPDPREFEGLPDPEAFLAWMRTVQRQLGENQWITASQLPCTLADRIGAGAFALDRAAHLGFDEVAPALRRLFSVSGIGEAPAPAPFCDPLLQRAAFDSVVDELSAAAGWARRRLEADPRARIGIVVRGLARHRVAVERIFDDVLHPGLDFARSHTNSAFHISAGAPSSETPLVAAALLALRLQPGMPFADAEMLLRSPFIGVGRLNGARLLTDLRRQGVNQVSLRLETVRRAFPKFANAAGQAHRRQRPGEWSAVFSKLVALAGWPGPRPLSPAEHQTVEHWKKLLSDLASLDLVMPRITYERALSLLGRVARLRRFAPSDEDAPIQVMDVLEAAGSRFDALWIASLHAGAWPQVPRPNSFLPVATQCAAGMPHSSPERELAFARRVTARLLASAPVVICSFPRFSGEEPLRVSPLIEALSEAGHAFAAPETSFYAIFAARAEMQPQPPDQAPSLAEGTLQRGGMKVIKDQAACPFRAFAVHRLGASAGDSADLGISASERGSVAHEALDILWRELKSRDELLARPPLEIAALIERSVRAALDGRLSRRVRCKSLERARALEQEHWEHMLTRWLEEERRRPAFEVVESELRRKENVGGLILELKADRIDRLADGTHAIIDYKTSEQLTLRAWEGERPDEPQLPLYAAKCGRPVSSVHFGRLVPERLGLLGYEGADLQTRLPEWGAVVDRLALSFLRGDARVDPKSPPATCEFCGLHSLCRISDLEGANQAEHE